MTSNFDLLCADLDAASAQRDQNLLAKSVALHKAGALTANQVGMIDMALRAGVTIPVELRKAIADAGDNKDKADKPAKVAMSDVKPPLAHLAWQQDTRRRLSLARDAGAISNGSYHRATKRLDNGQDLHPDFMRALSAIGLGDESSNERKKD